VPIPEWGATLIPLSLVPGVGWIMIAATWSASALISPTRRPGSRLTPLRPECPRRHRRAVGAIMDAKLARLRNWIAVSRAVGDIAARHLGTR